MAKCSKCKGRAAIKTDKPLCKKHFIQHFENKVLRTIKKYKLISSKDRIIVGSSGGKDSTTTLYLLNKWFGNVTALAIDEGIPGYRNITLEGLKKFCTQNSIPLKIYTYKHEFGFTLSEAIKAGKELSPCNICGILRRKLLNTKARGYTKIATGHNMDDEAQSILMNLMKAQLTLLSRLGPMTGNISDAKFVPRIKPLYLCTEKEVLAYSLVKGFAPRFAQCPHSHNSFRAFIRDALNEYEACHKGAKKRLVTNFLKILPKLKQQPKGKLSHCTSCGEPSSKETCKACTTIQIIKTRLR